MQSDSTGRATDTRYQRMHSHTSNTHTAVQCIPFHLWQSLKTRGLMVKMVSSSESSYKNDNLVLFCCWCWCCDVGEWKKAHKRRMVWRWIPLKCHPCWDKPFFMFRSDQSSSPLSLFWLVNTKYQTSKIGSALFHMSHVFDVRWQRTSCQAAQTPHTGRSSRILYRRWHSNT